MKEDLDALWSKASPTAYAGATPALSNQMDATNAAGGIVDVKVGPDGKVMENLDALWSAAKPVKQVEQPAEKKTDWLRQLALAGRAAAEGITSLPMMAADAMGHGPILRALGDPRQSPMDSFKALLDKGGAYNPETKGERLLTDLVGGAAGSLVGGPGKQMLGTALAGGAGGLASGATREAGGGILSQIGAGLLGNMGTAGAIGLTKMGGRAIGNVVDRGLLPGGESRGAAMLANLGAGKDKAAIINELRTGQGAIPGMPIDAGQLAAKTGNAEFVALVDLLKKQSGSPAAALDKQTTDALRTHVKTLSQSDNPNARKEIIDSLNTRLGPDLQDAYKQANTYGQKAPPLLAAIEDKTQSKISALQDYGQLATESVQQQKRANDMIQKGLGWAGDVRALRNRARGDENFAGALDFGAVAQQRQAEKNFLTKQFDSLAQNGHNPLSGENLANKVESYLKKDGDMASDAVQEIMKPLGAKLRGLSDENGVITAANLHTIRKEIGDSIATNALAKGWDKRRVASLEMSVKNAIDDSMTQAGASGWKDWLGNYREGMKSANNVTIGREIEKTLFSGKGKVREDALLKAVDNASQSPDMLRKTGMARFGNIDEAMTGSGKSIKNDLVNFAKSEAEVDRLAGFGTPKAQKVIGAAFDPVKQFNALYRPLMIFNAITRQLEGKGGAKSIAQLTDLALNNPKGLADIMEKMTPAQKASFFDVARRAGASQAGLLGMMP